MESHKYCNATSRIIEQGYNKKWKSSLRAANLSIEINMMSNDIVSHRLIPDSDHCTCLITFDGRYTVENLRGKIDNGINN